MQVSEILSLKGSTLFTVTPDMMLSDCEITMAEQDIGSLVVMDNGRLAGMLTFREILKVLARRHLEQRGGPTRLVGDFAVRDVMVPDPLVVAPDTDVNDLR
ncbi:MAG: CBS domain-containing protein, partial [Lautropia sp.]|nr:CBS domain-containing protein [Lautropia sp.]